MSAYALVSLLVALAPILFGQTPYRKAPPEIGAILDAPATPQIVVSPPKAHALLAQSRRYPPIAELAEPMLGLAGQRINPRNNGPHRGARFESLTLVRLDTGSRTELRMPPRARFSLPRWSPDGAWFAALNYAETRVELWIGKTAGGDMRRIDGLAVNAAIGEPLQWMPDSGRLLVQLVPEGRGAPPQAAAGPTMQETAGKAGPARTYQDLLRDAHDEMLFDYYATAQLALVDAGKGTVTRIGKPAIFLSSDPSPDGRYVLVNYVRRPFSYLLPASSFPREVEVWGAAGAVVRKLASLPMRERVPIDGVPEGPRLHEWRPTAPASVMWIEALDGGDPKRKAAHRDRMLLSRAPFTAEPVEVFRAEHRWMSARWLERDGLALITDNDRSRRWVRTFLVSVDQSAEPRLLWSRSVQDRYGDPGSPVLETSASGHRVVLQSGDAIFLDGNGATPSGDRPFLDRYNLKTGATERLFRCDEESYESVLAVLSPDGRRLLTRRESATEPPNYFIRQPAGKPLALTAFRDPAPRLRHVRQELVTYQRPDGVPLSFRLYLPPDYKPGTRLPAVVWAYPREYNDAGTAGQVTGSTKRFTTITGTSHLFFLLAGYAILDGAAMPVIGDPETVNNTYLEQIVMSAKAAIDKAAELGVVDPGRVGVGGHSYGGFMTANLLAHSDLFRAGIARSGAYNRTLTPFGFQSERRTLWQAPDTYLRMSPFLQAHKISEPILLIHGEADNNSGTFPIQSERMYQAVRGNGGIARLVMLPHESHGYEARESVEHVIAEMLDWFDKHLKNAAATTSAAEAPR